MDSLTGNNQPRHIDNRAGDNLLNRDVQGNVATGDSDTLVGYNNVSAENPIAAIKNVFTGATKQNPAVDGINASGRQQVGNSDLGGPTTYPASATLSNNGGQNVGGTNQGMDNISNDPIQQRGGTCGCGINNCQCPADNCSCGTTTGMSNSSSCQCNGKCGGNCQCNADNCSCSSGTGATTRDGILQQKQSEL